MPLQALTNPLYVTFVRGVVEDPELLLEEDVEQQPGPEHPCSRAGAATAFRVRASLDFGLSMADVGQDPHGWRLHVKQLDAQGVSSIPVAQAAWSDWAVDPTPGDGALYEASGDVFSGALQIESQPLGIDGPEYCWHGQPEPCAPGTRSYVLILERPRTWYGEALNSVAFPFVVHAPVVDSSERPRSDDLSCEGVMDCSDKLPYVGMDEAACSHHACVDGQCALLASGEGDPCPKCMPDFAPCNAPCAMGVCTQGRCQCEGAPDEEPTHFGFAEHELAEMLAAPHGRMHCQAGCGTLHPIPEGEPLQAPCGLLDCVCAQCYSPELCALLWPICVKLVSCGYWPEGAEWSCVSNRALIYSADDAGGVPESDACLTGQRGLLHRAPRGSRRRRGRGRLSDPVGDRELLGQVVAASRRWHTAVWATLRVAGVSGGARHSALHLSSAPASTQF